MKGHAVTLTHKVLIWWGCFLSISQPYDYPPQVISPLKSKTSVSMSYLKPILLGCLPLFCDEPPEENEQEHYLTASGRPFIHPSDDTDQQRHYAASDSH